MRYLVLCDIHANLDALEAVLAAAPRARDCLLVLGDLVGYGGEPNGVIDRIRELEAGRDHPRQPRQGGLGIDDGQQLQPDGAIRGDVDLRHATPTTTATDSRRCRPAR